MILRLIPQSREGRAPLRVLCLGAHPDDIEIGCGGTLLRLLAERRVEVRYVVFSANPERAEEARASAAALLAEAARATVEIHAFQESYFPSVRSDIKDAFEALKRDVDPDLVFSHHRADLHQDHALLAALTWNTFRDHFILEYEIPKYEGDLGAPNVFVPLDEALARRKCDHLIGYFESQTRRSWFRASTFEALMRIRGVECNAGGGYAEAFHGRKILL